MSSRHPAADPDDADDRGVAVDPVTALGTALSRLDGRLATLADRAGQGPLLVAVVERDSPPCHAALRALVGSGARFCVVSQGRPEAATELRDACGLDERDLLVEPAPHPVSDALAAEQVPTFVLIDGLELSAWQDGWDRRAMHSMVARAGGHLDPQMDVADDPRPSRLALDEEQRRRAEERDAARGR
jgi:hypothetical protein